jgi:hypothetical protein
MLSAWREETAQLQWIVTHNVSVGQTMLTQAYTGMYLHEIFLKQIQANIISASHMAV